MRCAINENSTRLFADDTSILVNDADIALLRNKSKECFLQLHDWCLCNKLMINQDKTKCVLFHMSNKPVPRDFCALNVGAIDIEIVKEVTYLGVILDEKLNWHKQNESICKSLLQFFGLFNHIKSFVTKSIARQLYAACIYSRIKYGIEIFGSYSKQVFSKIQVMQNKLLKLLLNLDRRTPTTELHKNLSNIL